MTTVLTFGSLFAGIGGFDLGFERAGMVCKWQVEIDEFCNRILERRYPGVRRWQDVRTFPPQSCEFTYSWRGMHPGPFSPDVRRDTTVEEWGVDVICGGFPCQDVSNAGAREGITGARSGLFFQLVRIIRLLRPRIVVLENVAALVNNGLATVLAELAASGFDAEWDCIPACSIGAPHERDRIFIVAYAAGERCRSWWQGRFTDGLERLSNSARWNPADADSAGLAKWQGVGGYTREECQAAQRNAFANVWQSQWPDEPALLGVDDGIPDRVDRVRVVGNSIVPQIAEWIGRKIVESMIA